MIFARTKVIVIYMSMMISDIAGQIAGGQLSARDHVESCLSSIHSEDGRRAFITVDADSARRTADQIDRMRAAGAALPAFAGVSMEEALDPDQHIGRAPEQVDRFIDQCLSPIRHRYASNLGKHVSDLAI